MMRARLLALLVTPGALLMGCAAGEAPAGGGGEGQGGTEPVGGSGGADIGGGDEGGGGAAPVPQHCDPEDDTVISEGCGYFVDPAASPGGNGSPSSPFRTISGALASIGSGPASLYVCAGDLDDSVTIPAGMHVHGGVVCGADWRWHLSLRTAWTAGPNEIPLTVTGGAAEDAPTIITGFDVTASAGEFVSASSVAALIDGGFAELERVSLTASDATAGSPGGAGETVAGQSAEDGGDATSAIGYGGGGASPCGSTGGKGGQYVGATAGSGKEGLPAQGNGGLTTNGVCQPGGPGWPGDPGMDGADGGIGSIDVDGFHPADGGVGTVGAHGGGGGGGGASTGHAGGGGGGGGCGGAEGIAGTGGGSSIALIVLGSTLKLTDVALAVGHGGNGGFGWTGGLGGSPGAGGLGYGTGCAGGAGGVGGNGGHGGNGGGGHAALVAFTGEAPALDGATYEDPTPDLAGVAQGEASPGQAVVTLSFDPDPG